MASVEKNVAREVIETATFTLTLSEAEAEALVAILARVGGSRTKSLRKYTDSITGGLRNNGVRYFARPMSDTITGNLVCNHLEGEA